MRAKRKIVIIIALVFAMSVVVNVGVAQAQGNCDNAWTLGCPIIPTECTDDSPDGCGFVHMAETLIHIAHWLLAVIGAVGFAYFVYGGFLLLTAAGNSSQVDHGRRVLIGTVIGIFLVLGAFQLVSWTGKLLGGGTEPADFGEYLDTSGSGSGAEVCYNDGDRCSRDGQNVYACMGGSCSDTQLCVYWSQPEPGRQPNSYDVSSNHICVDNRNGDRCVDGSIREGLCALGNEWVCCVWVP